jgi:hypothetical protein
LGSISLLLEPDIHLRAAQSEPLALAGREVFVLIAAHVSRGIHRSALAEIR